MFSKRLANLIKSKVSIILPEYQADYGTIQFRLHTLSLEVPILAYISFVSSNSKIVSKSLVGSPYRLIKDMTDIICTEQEIT